MKKRNCINYVFLFWSWSILSINLIGCKFLTDFFADGNISQQQQNSCKSITLSANELNLKIGDMSYLKYKITPSECKDEVFIDYDSEIIKLENRSSGLIISAIKEGKTSVTVTCGEQSDVCIITVAGNINDQDDQEGDGKELLEKEPYIYSNTSIIKLSTGSTEYFYVSLYGGTAADVNDFTFTLDKEGIIEIEPTGQYCNISAVTEGYARIKVTHTKASYAYYVGVYVFKDVNKATYLTTNNNILKINCSDGDKTAKVTMVNPKTEDYFNELKFEKLSGDTDCCDVVFNSGNLNITPIKAGTVTLRITHPDCEYPLDIIVKIVELVENVYIKPSATSVILSGDERKTVSLSLSGTNLYSPFTAEIEDETIAECYIYGNELILNGLNAEGFCSVTISNPLAQNVIKILVIAEKVTITTVDASCYLTTNSNYIKTKVGADDQIIEVSLKGGKDEDSEGFIWSINQESADGISDVITLESINGIVTGNARMASSSYVPGQVLLHPVSEGSATITVTHPKSYYSLEILVKVLNANVTEEELQVKYLSTSNNVIVINQVGVSKTVSVNPVGITANDCSKIYWKSNNNSIARVIGNGSSATITSVKEGETQITVTHPDSENTLTLYVLIGSEYIDVISGPADDNNEVVVDASCYLTTENNYIKTKVGADDRLISVVLNGGNDTDTGNFTWSIKQEPADGFSNVITLTSINGVVSSRMAAKTSVTGQALLHPVSEGSAVITVTNPKSYYSLEILVKVLNANATEEELNSSYLSTTNNVVNFTKLSLDKTVEVKTFGIPASDYNQITWKITNPSIAKVVGNGTSATITSIKDGETQITVTHPNSENSLTIFVRVNSGTEANNESLSQKEYFLSTNYNYIKTKVGAEDTLFTVLLQSDNKTILSKGVYTCRVSQNPLDNFSNVLTLETISSGQFIIHPVSEGSATITVTNSLCEYPLEILVKVLNANATEEELMASYLSTFYNLVTFTDVNIDKSVSVSAFGISSADYSKISWTSKDPSIAKVVGNGTSATITSVQEGETQITVTHPDSENILTIHARVGINNNQSSGNGSSSGSSDGIQPGNISEDDLYYLTTSSNYIKTKVDADDLIVTVNLIGSSNSKIEKYFWSVENNPKKANTKVITIENYSSDGILIHPVSEGSATITVTNEKAPYPVKIQVKVFSDEEKSEASYLSTDDNVVILSQLAINKKINVKASGISSADYSKISWTSKDPSIAKVVGNGTSATITSVQEGETQITVTHPNSENSLTIYVRVGSEYVPVSTSGVKYISVNKDVMQMNTESSLQELVAKVVNCSEETNLKGFSFTIADSSIASIQNQFPDGKAYIKALRAGQTEITVTHTDASFTKKVLVIVDNTESDFAANKYLTTSTNVISMGTESSKSVTVNVINSDETVYDGYTWKSSDPFIASISESTSGTALLHANSSGTCKVTVTNKYCMYPLEIIISVVDSDVAALNPYIQLSTNVQQLSVKDTAWKTVTAELIGGTEQDQKDFSWQAVDSTMVQCYGQNGTGKIKALKAGTTYVSVTHPKAAYSQQLLCICEDVEESECSINVSTSNILTLKPSASGQTIVASLVNGKETDKYNFTWSLDVYGIVDLDYSANTAVVTPIKEGTATLTVHHPKSAYDQSILIKVQQYDKFGFATTTKTITQGKTSFVNMEVPASNAKTYIRYTSKNPDVAVIEGTSQVCQITGIAPGRTTVTAELVISTSVPEVVTATSEMLVAVEALATSDNYITGSPTVYTMPKGTNKTLNAGLSGADITPTDVNNLVWKSSNSSIVKLRSSTGKSVYAEAVGEGECTITISHEKCNSDLVYWIIVPEEAKSEILLSKTYVKLDKNKETELKATITNSSETDYKNIVWSVDDDNIVEIYGSGQTIEIMAKKAGTATITARLPNGSTATCEVIVDEEKYVTFSTNTMIVAPGEDKTFTYRVSPKEAVINWSAIFGGENETFSYEVGRVTSSGLVEKPNEGIGTVTVKGVNVSSKIDRITAVSEYAKTATLTVNVSWQYNFALSETSLKTIKPCENHSITYTSNPENIKIEVMSLNNLSEVKWNERTKTISIDPVTEGSDTIEIRAINKANNEVFSTKKLTALYQYNDDDITFKPVIISKAKAPSNSKLTYYDDNDGTIHIADGEELVVQWVCEQEDAAIKNITISNKNNYSSGSDQYLSFTDTGGAAQNKSGKYKITSDDIVWNCYHITAEKVPYFYEDWSYFGGGITIVNGTSQKTLQPQDCYYPLVKEKLTIYQQGERECMIPDYDKENDQTKARKTRIDLSRIKYDTYTSSFKKNDFIGLLVDGISKNDDTPTTRDTNNKWLCWKWDNDEVMHYHYTYGFDDLEEDVWMKRETFESIAFYYNSKEIKLDKGLDSVTWKKGVNTEFVTVQNNSSGNPGIYTCPVEHAQLLDSYDLYYNLNYEHNGRSGQTYSVKLTKHNYNCRADENSIEVIE